MTVILQQLGRYKLWLVLMGLCLFMQMFHLEGGFRFDRQLIEQWQVWRVLTGHIVHLNWAHLMLNMAGLFMVMVFFAHYQSNAYWSGALVFMALFCSAGLLLDMQLDRYVGFSGVLHGLFIIGGRWEFKRYKISGGVLLTLIVFKLLWEQLYGALPGSESMSGGKVAVNAHLYGAIAGAIYLLISETINIKRLKDHV